MNTIEEKTKQIDLAEAARVAQVSVDEIIERMKASPGGTLVAKLQVTRKGAWNTVAADGWPAADSRERGLEFFCWGPGHTQAVVLDFWPGDERPGFERAPCFGDECGPRKEVTHWLPVEYPACPRVENWTLVGKG